MTRLPGLDPEVLEDLRRREASTGEGNRTRRARNPWADAATVEIVQHWPCKRCSELVGVTQEAVTALAILNGQLAVSGRPLIPTGETIACDTCKRADDEREAKRRRPHAQRQIAGFERPSGMRPARKGRQ